MGDRFPEPSESFRLVATIAADAGLFGYFYSSNGIVTIADDDMARASSLYVDDATILEGNQGNTTVEMSVRLEPASAIQVTVNYSMAESTSPDRAASIAPVTGTLIFAPGEVLKTVPVQVIGNTGWQGNRKIPFTLSSSSTAILGKGKGTLEIVEDDDPIHLLLPDQVITEGNSGITSVRLTIQLDQPAQSSPKVWLKVESGRATLGADFQAPDAVIYPAPGATSVSFDLPIVGDTAPECDEGFLLTYTGVYTGDDAPKTARILIRDDDGGQEGCPDPFSATPALPDAGAPVTSTTPPGATTPDASDPSSRQKTNEDAARSPQSPAPDAGIVPVPLQSDGGTVGANSEAPHDKLTRTGCDFMSAGRTASWSGWLGAGALIALWARRKSRRRD